MQSNPTRIGKYKVISQVGKGGMGAVYKAEHPTLKRIVIIKKLTLTDSKDFVERFKREARIMMDFRHENIVQVFDHFKEGNAYHIVMEYVDGITLEELISSRRFLTEEAALLIFYEVCKALKYAHDRQVIHRDIKPANILLSSTGIVKLVDFGVSAILDAAEDEGLTKAGMTIGTPSYLAPEQISNAKNRDRRSDIYSLGVLLYEMVIGKKPYRGGFTPEVIALIEKGKYTLPRKINPKIKASVQRLIKKAMHHKVQKRFQDLSIVISKVSRYVRKYKNQTEINQAIKLYLEGKEDLLIKPKGVFQLVSSKALGTLFALLVMICLAGGGALWAVHQGLHYKYLYPDQYGTLQMMVKVRKGYKTVEENYIKATLYKEEDNTLSKQDQVQFEFFEVEALENSSYYTLQSRKVFLPENMYILILYVENEQFRENFYLRPYSLQKNELDSIDGRNVLFQLDKTPPSLPVDVSFDLFDIISGRNLTGETEISFFEGGNWREWTGTDERSRFHSGQRYRLRFKHPGFFTKYYNMTIMPEQTKVSMDLNLVPLPGSVSVSSEVMGVDFTINGSDSYIDGERDRQFHKIPMITDQPRKFVLPPGKYLFAAEKSILSMFGRKAAEKTVSVESRDDIHLKIRHDSAGNSLQMITD